MIIAYRLYIYCGIDYTRESGAQLIVILLFLLLLLSVPMTLYDIRFLGHRREF